MAPKKSLTKKPLSIDCEGFSGMEASIYSEIGKDGLRFLKHDLMVGKQGLTSISGAHIGGLLSLNKDSVNYGKVIGKGASCTVHQGIYKPLDIKVAIKTINVYDQPKRHQMMKDISILLANIIKSQKQGYPCHFLVNLYGAYFQQGSIKVILQLMDIGSLQDIPKIYKAANLQHVIDQAILAKIAIQILCGLSYLHTNNQLHRDIKPANILMNSKGEVKITDFGISKELDFAEQMSKTFVGTYTYMSPERLEAQEYDSKGDIWSFGVVMLELATGEFPFASKNNSFIQILESVKSQQSTVMDTGLYSSQFIDFIGRTLQRNPKNRASSLQLLGHRWILDNISKPPQIPEWLQFLKAKLESKN